MGPTNSLMGDSMGVELPQMQPDDKTLVEEKKMAAYSKTDEFARIQKHCQERIEFYHQYLPNGAEVALDVRPTAEDWSVANRVIAELKLLMNMYEVAAEVVEQENER